MNFLDQPVDDSQGRVKYITNGYVTYHADKLLCYLDIQGIAEYYNHLTSINDPEAIHTDVVERLLKGYLDVLKTIDNDRYSVHVISDSTFIVPKSKPRENKSIPTYRDFFKMIFSLYEMLFENNNPARFLITRGKYFSTGINDYPVNILPGGDAYLNCFQADSVYLKGKGPGIFSNLGFLTGSDAPAGSWQLINIPILKDCIQDYDRLLHNISNCEKSHKQNESEKLEKRYNEIKTWLFSLTKK